MKKVNKIKRRKSSNICDSNEYKKLLEKPIGTNGRIQILDIRFWLCDYILTSTNKRYKLLRFTKKGEPFFIQNGVRYYLQEFTPLG